jgi:ribonuclease Y
MSVLVNILVALVAIGVGAGVTLLIKGRDWRKKALDSEQEAGRILDEARRSAATFRKEAEIEAKDTLLKMRTDFEAETKETRTELKRLEKRIDQKEENVERRHDQLEQRDKDLGQREKQIDQRESQVQQGEQRVQQLVTEQQQQLEHISGLSAGEAKDLLLRSMENEARYEGAKLIKRIEADARAEADKKSKEILATAIQRYAGEYVAERTVSVVQLPSDEMKGRIIGREGRNIRALEAATGIDLIIDDTPEAVILSGFNPVRREVARLSLIKLIADGRIHPARIEDVVKKVAQEVDVTIKEAGEQAAFDLGVHGIHGELVKHLGQLKFRTSYAQNVLQHSIEVGFLCGVMAAELGLNVKLARRMGLLHDLGKAVDHEVEGPTP